VLSDGDVTILSDDGGAGAIDTDWDRDCGGTAAVGCELPTITRDGSPIDG